MSWCEVLVPNTHQCHCPWIKSLDVWVWTRTDFLFHGVFFFYIVELTRAAVTSAWTSFMPGHNSAVNTSLLLNWPKSAPGFQTSLHAPRTPASFDLHTKPRPEPRLLIFLTICLLLVCTLSQLLGEHRLPRGDQRGSACSSLWSSFSQRINICTLSSSLCRWAW